MAPKEATGSSSEPASKPKAPSKPKAAAKAAPEPASRASRRRRPDRAAAERALKDAALSLLERDGILAGLNMQEVADAAGVNRGLIHHYFGSRSALIRAAIDDELRAAWAAIADTRSQPFVKRASFVFRWNIRNPMFARLIALLALDGDESFEPIPFADRQLEEIEHATSVGLLPDDTDAVAMLVAWEAAMEGYALIREGAARQLGVPQRELDWRVLAELGRLSGSDLAQQAATKSGSDPAQQAATRSGSDPTQQAATRSGSDPAQHAATRSDARD